MKEKILLHTCCGPCFLATSPELKEFEITSYFYNPNIWPNGEFEKRKENLELAIKESGQNTKIIVEKWNHKDWSKKITDKDHKNRCQACWKIRLEKTAQRAKKLNIKNFSTTLLSSIYQDFDKLSEISKKLAEEYNLNFVIKDFYKNYRQGQNEARELEIYRQKYCGCKYSLEEN